MDPYGWTCQKCPSRGSRSVVGDFVGVKYHHYEETPVEGVPGVVSVISETRHRTEVVGYPERCKTCNRRYTCHKRAREAGLRLEMVRKAQTGARWKHLKFMTCTWPSEWTTEPEPDLKEFKVRWRAAREKVADAIGALGGTDVVEVITKHDEDRGMWKHHIHTHGLWCAPFVPMDDLRSAVAEAGIGRFEYTILRERTWEDSTGRERVKPAIWCAIDYLAKYLTKANDSKRQVWGDLRSWKEYLPENVCRGCVKTTRQAKDYQHCQCKTTTGGRS
jgi:hypothetical protein